MARVGGAGGHSHSSGGHSSSHSYSSHSYSGSGGSGGSIGIGGIIVIIIIVIIVLIVWPKIKGQLGNVLDDGDGQQGFTSPNRAIAFPEGLDQQKVAQSFYAIQDAWQRKDLKDVRKWLSDGMYQRLTAQFAMMEILGQQNRLSNIRIQNIAVDAVGIDGDYQTAEVGISFVMDDSFISTKYPEFNEDNPGDEATEFWTFIKRTDGAKDKNLYNNNNCPNCGAPFEQKMGEISRCSNCGTLTNSAEYDWVLSEITQEDDYSGGAGMANNPALKELMKADSLFAVQRVEDIASNVFMQIMEVFTGQQNKKLSRFADEATAASIVEQKKKLGGFIFDRLYLNYVTLSGYDVANNLVNLHFNMAATFRRAVPGQRIQMLDDDFVTRRFSMTLSRKVMTDSKTATGETVFSYECSNCGAPYTDTTEATCNYCDAPVIDTARNWVLTQFNWA